MGVLPESSCGLARSLNSTIVVHIARPGSGWRPLSPTPVLTARKEVSPIGDGLTRLIRTLGTSHYISSGAGQCTNRIDEQEEPQQADETLKV